ncbi:MAG: IS1 family transposase [Oligoflexia bacterium]|nr:IS1 family transposase [Oligoflexia bacterium]
MLKHISKLFKIQPNDLNVNISRERIYKEKKQKLIISRNRIEADEMWSFVQNKKNEQWIWVAFDPDTNQVAAFYVGNRDMEAGKRLLDKIPEVYKTNTLYFTDKCSSYNFIPEDMHIIVKEGNRVTNHVERFFCTLRQRVSRLVRSTLAFSKKNENHINILNYR